MRLTVAGLAVAVVTLCGPLPAHADGTTYRGGCGLGSLNDTTPGGTLGGQESWQGVVRLAVVPTASGLPSGETVTAWCTLRINGVDGDPVLGPVTGAGAVAAAGTVAFQAAVTDSVEICAHVTTASGTEVRCLGYYAGPLIPPEVVDLVNYLIDTTYPGPVELVDAIDCPVFRAIAPTVNTAVPGVMYVDPAQGDVYVGGTGVDSLVYDCPPYVTP